MRYSQTLIIIVFVTVMALLQSCSSCNREKEYVEIPREIPELNTGLFRDADSAIIAEKAVELDKKFSRLQKLTGFNGSVLYAEKGRVIFRKAYGFQNVRRSKEELKTTDAFQLASVSKMFTAMAIMILKNDGKLDYDEDIRTYLPDFPYEGVTARWLMVQRAGLPRYMSLAHKQWKNKKLPMDNSDVLNLFVEFQPDVYFKPNSGFHYCNTNYALLANIVESISGQHFDEFVKMRIFDPLEMDDSFVYNMRGDTIVSLYVEEGVPGYYRKSGWRWREMTNDYLNGVMGDKNVYTSVEDLFKFDRALDNFSLVPDSVLSEAFQPGSPKYWKRKNNYGFGWRIKQDMDSTVYHFGWWKGFRTFYIRDMRHQKTLIVLTNKDKGPGSNHFWNIIKADTLPLGKSCDLESIKLQPV